jgi:hypothetical protein
MPPPAALIAIVRAAVDDVADRQLARPVAVARAVERILVLVDGDELRSDRIRRENEAALLEMAALGNSRDAAMPVARRRTNDPHQREMSAQRFRRFRREKKKAPRRFKWI